MIQLLENAEWTLHEEKYVSWQGGGVVNDVTLKSTIQTEHASILYNKEKNEARWEGVKMLNQNQQLIILSE